MSEDWNTKYGTRRVRRDPPTLDEAIFAAIGITDDQGEQAEIAAALMGLPYDEVHAALVKTAPPRKDKTSVVFAGPASAPRTIVVVRKLSRRVVSAADRVQRPALNSAG
jgi:hypothetical protein